MKNSHRLPAHVKPERYKIMLKPDLNEFTFTGEETIYLSLEKSTKEKRGREIKNLKALKYKNQTTDENTAVGYRRRSR